MLKEKRPFAYQSAGRYGFRVRVPAATWRQNFAPVANMLNIRYGTAYNKQAGIEIPGML